MSTRDSYAVCQQGAVAPSPEVLAEAYELVPGLTAIDAKLGAHQAFGVLAEGCARDVADAMCRHLVEHGCDSVVVPDAALALPKAYQLRRADLVDRALVVYDVYGRAEDLAWESLRVAHVGCFQEGEIVTTKEAGYATRGDVTVSWDAEHDVVETLQISLELILDAGRQRYAIAPSPFDYRYLGERKRLESRENFALLLQDLVRRAPETMSPLTFRVAAGGNGVEAMREYPSRRLFERHLKWLSWRQSLPS